MMWATVGVKSFAHSHLRLNHLVQYQLKAELVQIVPILLVRERSQELNLRGKVLQEVKSLAHFLPAQTLTVK